MKLYGFIPSFPIICHRDSKGHLHIKDGQHRLAFAETLGLPVHWVEEPIEFDIALINSTAKVWVMRDFAEKHAANGKQDYRNGLDFADKHKLSIGTAFSLLAGTTGFTNVAEDFRNGNFKIKDREWAEAVAGIYVPISTMAPATKNMRLVEACMAICRVAGFDASRLLSGAERCREKLVSYSTREAYLEMLEHIYNFGRTKLVALKIEALKVMRSRNATTVSAEKAKKKKHSRDAA